MSLNILLVSETMIKDRTVIHGNIDPKLIFPDIKVAQDIYIMPILGTALFDKLLTLVNNNTIGDAGNVNYKTLLDKYLVDALIYYTLSELPTTISYQFWNKGVLRKTGLDSETPSMQELIDLSNKYRMRAEFYADKMKNYLIAKAHLYFPEYLNPGSEADTIQPNKAAYKTGIYLGSSSKKCCKGDDNWQPYSE